MADDPPGRDKTLESILRYNGIKAKAKGLARRTKNLIKESGAKASPRKIWQKIRSRKNNIQKNHYQNNKQIFDYEVEDYTESYCNEAALVTDVQVVTKVYEDAPSDLRHLFWLACARRGGETFKDFRDAWVHMNAVENDNQRDRAGSSGRSSGSSGSSGKNKNAVAITRRRTHEREEEEGGEGENGVSERQREVDRAIVKDLDRIFPGHEYLDSQAMKDVVYSILRSYSMYDEEVGYCQGMAYMATITALYMTERDAFGLCKELMDERGCNLRAMYLPGLGVLQEMLAELDERMEAAVPEVSKRFRACGVQTMLFATSWFLTLYASSFPIVMTCRLIDVMLSEGNARGVLLRVALAVLEACQKDLVRLTDTEEVMSYLQTKCAGWTADQLRGIFDEARGDKGGEGEGEGRVVRVVFAGGGEEEKVVSVRVVVEGEKRGD